MNDRLANQNKINNNDATETTTDKECKKYLPNPFKFGFCMSCQVSKRTHSDVALLEIIHQLIVHQCFTIRTLCRDENCEFTNINGERHVFLYDSGIMRLLDESSGDLTEIDLSLHRLSMVFRDRRECHLSKDSHSYVMHTSQDIVLAWKSFFRKLADQNSSVKPPPNVDVRGLSTSKDCTTNVGPVRHLSPVPEAVDLVDKPVSNKTATTRYNIKSVTSSTELKQLQLAYEKLEADLKKEQSSVCNVTREKEELAKKVSVLERRANELKKERDDAICTKEKLDLDICSLNATIALKIEFNDQQLDRISQQLGRCAVPSLPEFASYKFLIDYLCTGDSHASFLNSLLRRQLERLIHYSEIDAGQGHSLLQYLTSSINMSLDSVAIFLSKFLASLSTQISPAKSTKSDLRPDVQSMILSVVNMDTPSDRPSVGSSFQQTALEIAYLLGQRIAGQFPLSNGYSEPMNIDEVFNEFLLSQGIESVSKVFVIELGRQINDKYRVPPKVPEQVVNDDKEKKGPVNELFESVWEDLVIKLDESESSNKDLMVAIEQLSVRNQELETASRRMGNWRNIDQLVNYYATISHKLCGPCQSALCEQLQSPVASLVEQLVLDFTTYWRCINDLTSFLANKKTSNCDVRTALDMLKSSSQKFDSLVSNLREITQRDIRDPGAASNKSTQVRPIVNGKVRATNKAVTKAVSTRHGQIR